MSITERIDGHWLVEEHDSCTCDPHMGSHQYGCGLIPLVDLRGLPGWDTLEALIKSEIAQSLRNMRTVDDGKPVPAFHDVADWLEKEF